MEGVVYLLCAGMALSCAALLFRGFKKRGTRLLLWCAVFFLSLTIENMTVFSDQVFLVATELAMVGTFVALVGVTVLLVGLIWDIG